MAIQRQPLWSEYVPRPDNRANDRLRHLQLERNVSPFAEGSCRVAMGDTVVHCTASVEEGAPPWRKGTGLGWITAEYSMLPRATSVRTPRERHGAGGRTSEIQRLIGRSLRASVDAFDFGEYTVRVDCDVLQADGGTRTASVTGGMVALFDAMRWLSKTTGIANPVTRLVAAVSVGMVDGEARLDLCYEEDVSANVDANVVKAFPDRYVEMQGTGEESTFSRRDWDALLTLADSGIAAIFQAQHEILGTT